MDRARGIGIVGAALVAVVGLWAAARMPAGSAQEREGAGVTVQPRPVEVVLPERRRLARRLTVPGTIEAWSRAELGSRVSGYLAAVSADVGDHVAAGAVLAEVAVPERERELAAARAGRAAEEARLALARGGEFAAAEAGLRQAESALAVARSAVEEKQVAHALAERRLARQERLFGEQAIAEDAIDLSRGEEAAARAGLEMARAKAGAAEADVERARAELSAARDRIGAAAAESALAAAEVERLEAWLELAKIRAPLDGLVAERMAEPGALVRSDGLAPLFVVERTDVMRVVFDVPEADLAGARVGTPVRIRPFALADGELEGPIARIASSLGTATRTMRAEVDLANEDGRLLHGLYADVALDVEVREDALAIPARALLSEAGKPFVYAVEDGRAARRELEIGFDDAAWVEVKSGLAEGEPVIVTGQALLRPGAPVRAVAAPEGGK